VNARAPHAAGRECSATRVHRLLAGELAEAERTAVETHLLGCPRCQKVRSEWEGDRRALEAELPFERFAAGVAERLARPDLAPRGTGLRWAALALAASIAVGVAVPLVGRLSRAPLDEVRLKGGGVSLTLYYAQEGGGARALGPGEPVPEAARLRVALQPAGRRFAAVLLVDEDGVATLYAGPVRPGPLPGAFEWTGRRGELVAVVDDAPVDAGALAEQLRRAAGVGAPGGERAVATLELRRAGP
jgi:hypothetical protein